MPSKRLLFVGNYLDSSVGTRAISEDLAIQLGNRGWEVTLTSRRTNKVLRLADMVWTVFRCRNTYDAAVVDLYSGAAFLWAECACWLLSWLHKPFVLTLHGGNLPKFAAKNPGRVRRLLTRASAVTAPSNYLLKQMRDYRGELLLVPNPLQLGNYPYSPKVKARPRLIWLRAFHKIYDAQLAVSAVALLRSEFPDLSLTMIGPDKDGSEEGVRKLASEIGIADCVHFAGPVLKGRVPEELAAADIFLNTSMIDNTPVSVIEAMACGLCVVSTRVGGIPDLLTHQSTALLTNPGDASSMAAAIRRILRDDQLAQHLSKCARDKAATFDWARVLPSWERLLNELIPSKSQPESLSPVLGK